MKAIRVSAQQNRTLAIADLPLPTIQRKGVATADRYRQQSTGAIPRGKDFNPIPSNFLRTIVLSDGAFKGLASQAEKVAVCVDATELFVAEAFEVPHFHFGP